MGLSGKYDFKGIQKAGVSGLRVAFPGLLKFGKLGEIGIEFLVNLLANHGLVLLNVGANYGEGELDQRGLDRSMDKALSEITIKGGRDKLTPAQKKAIDDEVIKAARKFVVIARP